jgi:transposase-like protein
LAGDAQWRALLAGLFCGVLRRWRRLKKEVGGGARSESETGKTASRAERASNVPRIEKDHAFCLNGSMKEPESRTS